MQSYGRLRNSFAEIHLGNLKHNLQVVRSHLGPGQKVYPMVKANAYGHGDVEVARALEGWSVDGFGVALIEEGIRLRQHGIQSPILTFAFFDSLGAEAMVKFNLTPVLSHWDQLEKLKLQLSDETYFSVHLKFNTGMARLGFSMEDASKLKAFFEKQTMMKLDGVCTHLVNAADSVDPNGLSRVQLQKLAEISQKFGTPSIPLHLLSSGAIGAGLTRESEVASRPGLSLYGVWPPTVKTGGEPLKPVMSLKTEVVHIHRLKKGESVSYGAIWVAPRESVIGVVPLGYADGYPRSLSNKAAMMCLGERVWVCGTVCMDYTMVDLTDLSKRKPNLLGEEVIAFGGATAEGGVSIETVADWAETIPYEIMTGVSPRVPRVFVH